MKLRATHLRAQVSIVILIDIALERARGVNAAQPSFFIVMFADAVAAIEIGI